MTNKSVQNIQQNVVEPTMSLLDWLKHNLAGLSMSAAAAGAVVFCLLYLRNRGRKALAANADAPDLQKLGPALLANTSVFFAIATGLKIIGAYNPLHESLETLINQLFIIALPFQVAAWARELVMRVVKVRAGDDRTGTDVSNAMSIIRFLVSVSVYSLAGITALDNLGVNVSALLAGLGIGGIAIGLAAKGVFQDLFAAMGILFDKPFKRGDSIIFDDVDGTVEKIGMMNTRVRSKYGPQVIIANQKLLESKLVNETDMTLQRAYIRFPLSADTPVAMLRSLPDLIHDVLRTIDRTRLHRAVIRDFQGNVLQYEVVIWIRHNSGNLAAETKSAFIIAMLERFEKEGIKLVTPTQIGLAESPDQVMLSPEAPSKTKQSSTPRNRAKRAAPSKT